MNIYFHIDELKRDSIVASGLKKKFKALGHNLVYGNRVIGPLLKIFHGAFDVIVLPRPHFIADILGRESLDWNQKVVILSTESLGIICKDHEVMARTLLEDSFFNDDPSYVNKISAFCLWGERQKKAIDTYAPEISKKCHIIGHPRHDDCALRNSSRASKKLKNIGIVTRANGLNDYYGRMAIESFEVLFDDHFQFEYINQKSGRKLKSTRPSAYPRNNLIVQSYDTQNLLKIMKALNQQDCKISVRCHPKENLTVWEELFKKCEIEVKISDSMAPITHWLEDIDVVIGPPSTTFYDAAIELTPCISIANIDQSRSQYIGELWEEKNELMKDIIAPDSIEEIITQALVADELVLSESIQKTLKSEADFPECRQSLDKFVDICIEIATPVKPRPVLVALYKITSSIYFTLWAIKNLIISREANSSRFTLSRSTISFIDSLTAKL
ncbi:hypothetical protein N9K42_05305 [Gammaproteobacteria bacterium]|jgi:surface carbohydrate biosynthesis protein|nr:hypothetical protein [Gammaproteobacteria bacterium]